MSHFREDLAKIGEETRNLLKSGYYKTPKGGVSFLQLMNHSIRNSKLYTPYGLKPFETHFSNHYPVNIEVTTETTLAAARRLREMYTDKYDYIAALNFASARHPGGGWLSGAPAQEESLARASALFPTINQFQEMYRYNDRLGSALYSDYIIYSPDVPVFRDDDHVLLDKPYTVSFITSPAPNAGVIQRNAPQDIDKVEGVLRTRIGKILRVAKLNGCDRIVLGAFGCGVFRNDPKMVATLFKEALNGSEFQNQFQHVVFAIYDRTPNKDTYKAFQTILG